MSSEPTVEPSTLTGKLRACWKADLLSGFLVFLIALPLCLGISLASGYPPIAGIYTAIIGGILCTFISNSELTIKGPAAGLIVIAVGAVIELGSGGAGSSLADLTSEQQAAGYRMALGVGVAAACLQIVFGLLRVGRLGDFFPLSAVHGMLAAIGVIIVAKEFPHLLGITDHRLGDPSAGTGPLDLLLRIPAFFGHLNPEIALIGLIGLIVLFALPFMPSRTVRRIPGPMLVLLVAVPLGIAFDLTHPHAYEFNGHEYHVGENFLITLPANFTDGFTSPDFSGLSTSIGWKFVVMFALIGSLESLLSAKAIDLIDPKKRKTNLDRDLLAVGVANTASAAVGGLPMISEIVRSKANIDNGARSRFADLFHALFLLCCVALIPGLLHRIPRAALAAMLVYTGFRLASPREFAKTWAIGRGQFLVFVSTIFATLATDLLIGIAVGILVELMLNLWGGLSPRRVLGADAVVEPSEVGPVVIRVRTAVVFSNWLKLKRVIVQHAEFTDVIVDLSEAKLIDHTVMEKLHEMGRDFERLGRRLQLCGLDGHEPVSKHPHAARKKVRPARRQMSQAQ